MMDKEAQLAAALKKADRLYKETGDEKHRIAAKKFATTLKGLQGKSSPPLTGEEMTRLQREQVADGMTLRPFGVDTGIEIPQGATEFLAGAGRRLTDIGTMGNREPAPEADKLLDQSGYATAGGITADMAAMAPLGVPSTMAKAAGMGALYGGATTSGDLKDRASAASAGAMGGAAGLGLTRAASRIASPKLDPKALELESQGVRVTPGRLVGGAATRLEDAATSMPLVGDSIRNRQLETLADYNKKILNDIVGELGETVDDVGREGVEKAANVVSAKYDDVLDAITEVKIDDEFLTLGGQLNRMVATLDDRSQSRFKKAYDGLMRNFDNENSLALGRTYKEAESSLRKQYQKAYDRGDTKLGDALRTLFKNTRDMARRQHPEVVGELEKVDMAYAKLGTVKAAANLKGAREGLFTPDHLLTAIKRKTPGSLYAQGKGFNQKATESAKEVLQQSVPDSGTAGRSLLAAASTGFIHPVVPLGFAAGGVANSRLGQDAMRKALLSRPESAKPVGDILDILAPYMGNLGTSAAINQ